ncbi:phosphoribosylaminoimidazolesuccinocarboxamide synthase [Serpentinicella alkaliphila]|uniref:Phosphoribosylaminoimidazole-succinocarboxamide synthase n=1 Tax=Serpentinicella alkaliphila TaxID=1734049 RepID=A0A4R2TJF7_9FIRM|nr:phosphoribosylaminoimidazolesuccinocarboxamide synthase [Serpentinicella alkaliphila]QUH24849.1 phosphoribosylaminoimidazolesuccinocarboxamide synthase [Serpentinicella alkaliphila]TCQ03441.1 phosphoribosylaminoimidazole-succinocarboxamide synthase [Serpentinicella alkaliphila]
MGELQRLEKLYEGKAKRVYKTNIEKQFIVEYKDDATAFNGEKKGTISNKGLINNEMSAHLFKILADAGIENHFIELLNEREMLVKSVEIIPIEVMIRNVVAGSLAKRLGLDEGTELSKTVIEFAYKSDELGDPMINDYHIDALNLATKEQLDTIKSLSIKINEVLEKYFLEKDLRLIDYKLEFGLFENRVILADEISPDTCRLWDVNTNEKLDKDRFRRDLGNVEESYIEVLRRLKA